MEGNRPKVAERILRTAEKPTEQEEAAREFNFVAESSRNHQELLRTGIKEAAPLVDFYERHSGAFDAYSRPQLFIDRKMPGLSPYLYQQFRAKYLKEKKFRKSLHAMTEGDWDELWKEVAQKGKEILIDAARCKPSRIREQDFSLTIREWLDQEKEVDSNDYAEFLASFSKMPFATDPYHYLQLRDEPDWEQVAEDRPEREELEKIIGLMHSRYRQKEVRESRHFIRMEDDKEDLWRLQEDLLFGARGIELLIDLLPEQFERLIKHIRFVDEHTAKQEHELGEGKGQVSASGVFNSQSREVTLIINEQTNPFALYHTFLHELGHAIFQDPDSGITMRMRQIFAGAAARELNHSSYYAVNAGAHNGLVLGLHEDFAECFMQYVLSPALLRDRNPERVKVIDEIMQKFYSGVSVGELRERFRRALREVAVRQAESKQLFLKSLENNENPQNEIVNRFPGQMMRFIDHLTEQSPDHALPDDLEERYVVGNPGVSIENKFDGLARKEREVMRFTGGEIKLFYEPTYDSSGRITSFKLDQGEKIFETFFEYNGDAPFPLHATMIEGQMIVAEIEYQKEGRVLTELFEDKQAGVTTMQKHYLSEGERRLERTEGYLEEERVFQRQFFYDKEGRPVKKTFESASGQSFKEFEYTYDDTV
jgi:hypothetical protein